MSDRIERIILRNLFYNEDFTRKAFTFLSSQIFLLIIMNQYCSVK